jgi:hypothetical protein
MSAATVNVNLFDRYTFAHMGVGFVLERLGGGFLLTLALAVGFEMVEDTLKDRFPGVFPNATHDTKLNSCGDMIGNMAGWALSRSLAGR